MFKTAIVVAAVIISAPGYAADQQARIKAITDQAMKPVLQEFNIPGMAVGISVDGKNYFFNYGVASKDSQQAVSQDTLFEIGSVSKTFTATLAAYAHNKGKLALTDNVSQYLPALRGSAFDQISLLNLATHTAGGQPLQVPDEIQNNQQLMDYFKQWKPKFAAGTQRAYSNPGIGLLGLITAQSMNSSFENAIQNTLFNPLKMHNSYFNVPAGEMKNYAQGYNKKDQPVRVNPGVLDAQAYGIKSSAADMLKFINANMQQGQSELQQAITATHTAYFKSGEITQDLIWEQYHWPADLKQLLAGNGDAMILQPNPATPVKLPPQRQVLINKTGSTGGFAAYVAFIPAKKMGIVILANKNYPMAPRVTAAHQIFSQLNQPAKD